ncbi:uncharacterized protein, MTH1187 family [Desulfurobacterium pacificum]|jgi:uncharacterized protein (TIGR00106 family)|uniref:Uncharacterized protein, MTH1187 family n=1 Tax=Desulfurobacterium pacificum TaxID=240166 RepID=A0ABY1NPE8_9BACT|nr:MTH1187 family thiamine-binding protein [Desulfurobacterium pacificum]SMP14392.1 uncharacterized protein, MTH1187 family [Desulfurobacterium pacificum]
MSVLVEFAMFPTDKGESVSSYVSRIIKFIDESGIPYKLTPMGTIFETETIEEALKVLEQAYKLLEPDCNRVYCTAKFDIRKGRSNRLEQKIKSIEKKIGKEVRK